MLDLVCMVEISDAGSRFATLWIRRVVARVAIGDDTSLSIRISFIITLSPGTMLTATLFSILFGVLSALWMAVDAPYTLFTMTVVGGVEWTKGADVPTLLHLLAMWIFFVLFLPVELKKKREMVALSVLVGFVTDDVSRAMQSLIVCKVFGEHWTSCVLLLLLWGNAWSEGHVLKDMGAVTSMILLVREIVATYFLSSQDEEEESDDVEKQESYTLLNEVVTL